MIPLQSPLLHSTLTKPVATRHPLQSLLLHSSLKPIVTQHPKAYCYMTLLKPVATWHPYKVCCYTTLLQNSLLHDTFTKPVTTQHPKVCCYTTPLTKLVATLLLSSLLHGNTFTKSQTIYKKPKYYFGNYLQKPKYYFGNYLQKKSPNTILATIYESPNTILATISKSQILFWQPFIETQILLKVQVLFLAIFYQKPKFDKILQILKSPNTILAKFYKSPILFWQHFINNPKLLLF